MGDREFPPLGLERLAGLEIFSFPRPQNWRAENHNREERPAHEVRAAANRSKRRSQRIPNWLNNLEVSGWSLLAVVIT